MLANADPARSARSLTFQTCAATLSRLPAVRTKGRVRAALSCFRPVASASGQQGRPSATLVLHFRPLHSADAPAAVPLGGLAAGWPDCRNHNALALPRLVLSDCQVTASSVCLPDRSAAASRACRLRDFRSPRQHSVSLHHPSGPIDRPHYRLSSPTPDPYSRRPTPSETESDSAR